MLNPNPNPNPNSPPTHHHRHSPKTQTLTMAPKFSSLLSDGLLFFTGAAVAALLFLSFSSLLSPNPSQFLSLTTTPSVSANSSSFYSDPSISYTIETPITNWDLKRSQWLSTHSTTTSFNINDNESILMVSGSQPGPCRNPIGDHLLLRFFKNKADYCRLHNIPFFYNDALLQPSMFSFWAKIPAIRSAMAAHPEAEWIWWVDSDAAFTDMTFSLPLHKYKNFNLVLHGWSHLVYDAKSWTSLNAGVLLIRNCQWSMDFIDRWSKMGPQSPEYDYWGKTQRSIFKDKLYKESDDQTGIAYMLLMEKDKWADKVYLESEFYFEGYWVEIVSKYEMINERYLELERKYEGLRRRRAERDEVEVYGRLWEEYLEKEGVRSGVDGWKRPFITHFTGCQPCSGDHNKIYSGENCYEGMIKALNFADDQVLRAYGFRHERLVNETGVKPLPFDFPAAS